MYLFSKRLKDLRLQHRYTQQELGKMINVTKVSVCCYEKGTRTPTIETLMILADIFNVPYTHFLGGDSYVVEENNEKYGVTMAKEEIRFIQLLRQKERIYKSLVEDPERGMLKLEKKFR